MSTINEMPDHTHNAGDYQQSEDSAGKQIKKLESLYMAAEM